MNFRAELEIINGNPFVFLPTDVLERLFEEVSRTKGPIPVKGSINGKAYQQTLVKYSGAWRLYISMKMLKDSPRRIGERIEVEIEFDPSDRSIKVHPLFVEALAKDNEAKRVFDGLSPSKQRGIVKYISELKNPESVERNVTRAINFLKGKERFIGRDSP